MKRFTITTGTVTYAIKAKDILKRNGYKAYVERVTSGNSSKGCLYAVIVESDSNSVIDMLRSAGIKIIDINEK